MAYRDWTIEDWRHIIWTNESYIGLNGKGGRVWITRHAGEEFHEDCLVPQFENKNSVIIWGGIYRSNRGCVSLVIFWQKGNINAQTYFEHVIHPVLYFFWYEESQQ